MSDEVQDCPLCQAPMSMQIASRGRNVGKAFWGCSRFPHCRGSRNADGSAASAKRSPSKSGVSRTVGSVAANARLSLKRGDLLISSDNALGPGKLVGRERDDLTLEYFDTPGQAVDDRYRESVSRASLKRLVLTPELRVFWSDEVGRWQSGRILETNIHGDIYVKGHEWEGFVSEERIHVRWARPLTDPVGFASVGLLESPLLVDVRRPFLQSILRQRSAAHGMSSALSSSIELHEHQIETAWRVLQDPIQRYLLADEVGLGKTIEAGIVIRQLLLDDPELTVQLVLPPFLIDQWRRELEEKFRIRDFSRAQIRFSRDDDPTTWKAADLLVVDEAHNLARLATSRQEALAARHHRLIEIATASPRLLMLSATPALHNEQTFLAMLKLLDPAVYGRSTVEDLRRRLESRAHLGRLFLGLIPELPGVLLKNRLAEVRSAFPDDGDVAQLADSVQTAVELHTEREIAAAIGALRTHVAEVYRVHRRMLRTRRTTALEQSYRVTGRTTPEPIVLESTTFLDTTRLLDDWRQAALAASEHDGQARSAAARALARAVSMSLDPEGLREWARSRQPANADEERALDHIESNLAYVDRRAAITRPLADAITYLFGAIERVVVFCQSTQMASELVTELGDLINARHVTQHLSSDDPAVTERAIRAFAAPGPARVLVADSSAEEGRNLQFVDVLVHVGVPADANRLEQRIGRCDRWSVREDCAGWRSYWVREAGDDASFSASWLRILRHGFGVLESSVASLQHAVDNASVAAWEMLFDRGVEAAEDAIEMVREYLAAEAERVREQDALDSIESSGDGRSVFSQMNLVEADASEFADLSDALLSARRMGGNLRFERVGDPMDGVGSYEVVGRVPGKHAQTPLVPGWRLLRDFVPLKGHLGTFRRRVAIERSDVRLYRYGDRFIDAVSDFLWNDDRGRAFGMWRWLPDWMHEERLLYRFDYAVEANPLGTTEGSDERHPSVALAHGLDRLSLCRRADGLLPPLIVSLWLDQEGALLTDTRQLGALQAPYAKPIAGVSGGDYALNRSRIQHAYELIPPAVWSERWRAAEAAARGHVSSDPVVRDALDRALAIAHREAVTRLNQLRLRSARTEDAELARLEQEIELESTVTRMLESSIRRPTLRLDSTGVVVLSGRALDPVDIA
ncbi:protein DpdE [Kribbella sp. NPDC051718]|uniref:protein DpdE n=1 Tax=Kribbella sp. NPDC051718 TaxID=3155168 RepID=UPI0034336CAD